MTNRTIGVSILCWKNYEDSVACIDSLVQSTCDIQKIVVVDNASKDGSIEELKKRYATAKNIVFVENPTNLGFAKGMNRGIRMLLDGHCDHIMLLNQDTVVASDMLERCLTAAVSTPEKTIVGPRIYYKNPPNKIWQGRTYWSPIKSGIVSPEKNRLDTQCDDIQTEVTFLTGCAILIPREVFQHVGLFDEDYYFYSEDLDYCYRARRAGFRMVHVPSASVWHNISGIAKDRTSDFVLYNLAKSHMVFLRKNFRAAYFVYGILIHSLLFTPYRMFQIIMGSRSLRSVLAWFKGTWDGLRVPLRRSSRD